MNDKPAKKSPAPRGRSRGPSLREIQGDKQFLFKLIAGDHIQADHQWEPNDNDLAMAKQTGVAPRAPSRTYKAGSLVPSNTDLAAKHGADKFQLVAGEESEKFPRQNAAPHGQVSEGFQVTAGDAEPEDFDPRVKAKDAKDAARLAAGPQPQTKSRRRQEPEDEEEFEDAPTGEEDDSADASADEEGEEVSDDELQKMTKAELLKLAEDNEVDLKGATTKHDIMARIKGE